MDRNRTIAALAAAAALSAGAVVVAGPAASMLSDDQAALARQPVSFDLTGTATQGGTMTGTAPAGARAIALDGTPVEIDADGRFLIAFNRDAPQSATLVATMADGSTERRTIAVAPRSWNIERVAINRRARTSSAAFRKRRAPELAKINAARLQDTDSAGWRQKFVWPVKGRISGMFGNQRIYNGSPGSYHSGIDIAVPRGTPFVAPADGVVTLAANRPFSLEGKLLMIDHGMGLNSAFLHASRLSVKKGDVVKRGQPIGRVGATGSATGPHLHWSMKWKAARIDPILLTGPME